MTTVLAILSGFILGAATEWTRAQFQISKRKADMDDLRFLLAPVIPHSPEDAIRRSGC